jgi:hypothetical protein
VGAGWGSPPRLVVVLAAPEVAWEVAGLVPSWCLAEVDTVGKSEADTMSSPDLAATNSDTP